MAKKRDKKKRYMLPVLRAPAERTVHILSRQVFRLGFMGLAAFPAFASGISALPRPYGSGGCGGFEPPSLFIRL